MNYSKNLIELIQSVAPIQKQLVIHNIKDVNNADIIELKANDGPCSISYILTAPKSYWDFPGTELAFYDFDRFYKCFQIYDRPNKDEALADTPDLDYQLNKMNTVSDVLVKSSKQKSKISVRTARSDVLAKPAFNKIVIPSIDAKFNLTEAEFVNLQKLCDSVIQADQITFNCDKTVKITLSNTKNSNYYDIEYDCDNIQVPFSLTIQTSGFSQIPAGAYSIEICKRGLVHFHQDREDDINMELYIAKKSA